MNLIKCIVAINMILLLSVTSSCKELGDENMDELNENYFAVYYVSNDGDDLNSGDKSSPFKTVEKARDTIREISVDMDKDILVKIGAGEYFLDEPIIFSTEDSGKNGFRVIYQGSEEKESVFTGGLEINTWEEIPGGILKTSLSPDKQYRQLYVNGKRAVRARFPDNDEWLRVKNWISTKYDIFVDGVTKQKNEPIESHESIQHAITIKGSPNLDFIDNVDGIEFVMFHDWATTRMRLDSIFSEGNDKFISFNALDGDINFKIDWPPKRTNQPFYLENSFEFLSEPGEWFYNNNTGELFYIPLPGETVDSIQAIVPEGTESFIKLEGTFGNPVKNITFRNLGFAYSRWDEPNEKGFSNSPQGGNFRYASSEGVYHHKRPSASFYAFSAHFILLQNCSFMHLGGSAIDFDEASSNNEISRNTIYDVSAIGIALGKGQGFSTSSPFDICNSNKISDNSIKYVGQEYHGSVGILIPFAKNTLIEHNEIAHLPYSGISCGWGWTEDKTVLENNVIRNNHIHDVMKLLGDGAGIYTLSRQDGTKIYGNYIHDLKRSDIVPWFGTTLTLPVAAIYLDAGSMNIEVRDNFVENVEESIYTGNTSDQNQIQNAFTEDIEIKKQAGIREEVND